MDFNLSEFQCPDSEEVDMRKTKKNVGMFLSAYLTYRQRVGQPREPKLTASFSLAPISSSGVSKQAEDILIYNEEIKEKFLALHEQFVRGISNIDHPFKPEIALRRKKIFFDRYILGHSIYVTAQRNNISDESVNQDSKLGLIQFANAIGAVVKKNRHS